MENQLTNTNVSPQETIVRLIISPKNLEADGSLKPSFITLRKDEEGISFLRYDLIGRDEIINRGNARANMYAKPNKPQKLYGWAEAIAETIQAISPETIVLKIDDPTNSPEHVTICFKTETGELTHGIITDIRFLYLFEKIRQVLKVVVV